MAENCAAAYEKLVGRFMENKLTYQLQSPYNADADNTALHADEIPKEEISETSTDQDSNDLEQSKFRLVFAVIASTKVFCAPVRARACNQTSEGSHDQSYKA
jgi:hypothetical protein